jgi:hypothetical protein
MNTLKSAAIVLAVLLFSTIAEARPHKACNGITGCTCGSTQARYFGLPRMVNGHNLWQAIEWTRAFPHTTLHIGAVMYRHGGGPTGHVSRVVAINDGCNITVSDERGEHPDKSCGRGNVFVDPSGNSAVAKVEKPRYQMSAKRNKRHTQVASVIVVDRLSIH